MDGGEDPPRRWLNDRRFNFATSAERIRSNVSQLVQDVQQTALQSPELLGQIRHQLQLISDLANGHITPAPPVAQAAQNAIAPQPPHPHPFHLNMPTGSGGGQTHHDFAGVPGPSHAESRGQAGPSTPASRNVRVNLRFSPTSATPLTIDRTVEVPPAEEAQSRQFVVNMDERDETATLRSMPSFASSDAEFHPDESRDSEEVEEGQEEQQNPPNNGANSDNEDWNRILELWNSPDVQRILKTILKITPFILVLCFKLLLQHLSGLIALSLGILVFLYANRQITKFVFSRTEGNRWDLVKAIVTVVSWLSALFYIFQSEMLWRSLLFLEVPLLAGAHVDLSDVLWVVLSVDLAAKFLVIAVKAFAGMGPNSVRANKKKRAIYQWLEYTSHLFRCCLPVRPWCAYILASPWTAAALVACNYILVVIYVCTKTVYVVGLARVWKQSTQSLLSPRAFGRKPGKGAMLSDGNRCSICFGDFVDPIELDCKHIFCEECITTWLDKQRTCPVCRSKVSGDNRDWKDGATTWMLQVF